MVFTYFLDHTHTHTLYFMESFHLLFFLFFVLRFFSRAFLVKKHILTLS